MFFVNTISLHQFNFECAIKNNNFSYFQTFRNLFNFQNDKISSSSNFENSSFVISKCKFLSFAPIKYKKGEKRTIRMRFLYVSPGDGFIEVCSTSPFSEGQRRINAFFRHMKNTAESDFCIVKDLLEDNDDAEDDDDEPIPIESPQPTEEDSFVSYSVELPQPTEEDSFVAYSVESPQPTQEDSFVAYSVESPQPTQDRIRQISFIQKTLSL